MKIKNLAHFRLPLHTIATLALFVPGVHAATIFSDDFSGGTGDIHNTTPDVTTGAAKWVASEQFNANGSILNATETAGTEGGSATLAFTPVNGLIYTLDASFAGVTGNANWLALGFVSGQSSVITAENRFLTDPANASPGTVGKAWMLYRGDTTSFPHVAYLGNATNGDNSSANFSTAFVNPDVPSGSTIDLRVVLDTTLGTGAWAATWYAKRPADGSFTVVRPTATLLNETINAVGIAKANNGITGTIESFSLTSAVPEPSCLALLGCGSLLMLRLRRR